MVAYNFKARFVAPIEAGTKTQTIRAERRGRSRHAGCGDTLQLRTGSRFKGRQFGTATCYIAASPIILNLHPIAEGGKVTILAPPPKWSVASGVHKISVGIVMQGEGPLDFFARADGFASWADMLQFWQAEHGASMDEWRGVLICWKDFQPS